jgi:hypothetical protein
MRERSRGAKVALRAPDRIRERGRRQATLAWEFAKHVERAPCKPGTRARSRCLAYGNISNSARAESVKGVEELLGAAPERPGFLSELPEDGV